MFNASAPLPLTGYPVRSKASMKSVGNVRYWIEYRSITQSPPEKIEYFIPKIFFSHRLKLVIPTESPLINQNHSHLSHSGHIILLLLLPRGWPPTKPRGRPLTAFWYMHHDTNNQGGNLSESTSNIFIPFSSIKTYIRHLIWNQLIILNMYLFQWTQFPLIVTSYVLY